jgi:hypothetical protein
VIMNSELEIMDEKLSWFIQKYYVYILRVRTMEKDEERMSGQSVL